MNKKSNNYIVTISPDIADTLKTALIKKGFEITQPPYTLFSAKKTGVSCTLYKSGKLMVQGKDKDEFIQFFLEPEILGDFSYGHEANTISQQGRIGIDESGKGDLFGPLCVAGLYAEGESILELSALGVRDSKALTDGDVIRVARELKKRYCHHVVKINPAKYNSLYPQFRNLNKMLAWGHATAIQALVDKSGCSTVIVDQFASKDVVETALKKKGLEVDLTQRHRAEEDLVVAGASILAREAFLSGLRTQEEQWGCRMPKGASKLTVDAAKEFAARHGKEALSEVTKLHFKSLDGIRALQTE